MGWLDPGLAARGAALAKPEGVGMSRLEPLGEKSARDSADRVDNEPGCRGTPEPPVAENEPTEAEPNPPEKPATPLPKPHIAHHHLLEA